ncbi:hypothetical protein QC762_106210 [Podospora pseudocomata]|uniref:Integral membrane protein n=2 Tax=Podospora TaxID=5144 RepID=A0ABR0HY11_9PEZI|nr:hypothetical protein QC762_106210 [Podospora pseudocomata]KAK4672799.1 hypothetical protein QC763_106210 [Podospora pseudopauciseta]
MDIVLIPEGQLPACVKDCGVLYDVNGGCVPPGAPPADNSVYNSCFCNDPRLAAWKTGTTGVCPDACASDPSAYSRIQQWFSGFCSNVQPTTAGQQTTSTSTVRPAQNSTGGTWIETHYQWVIFLVIMVVAIVGIWVGACIWRKRYLRKKDRQYALGANLAHATESGRVVPNESNSGSIHRPSAGMFEPAPLSAARVYEEKPKEKKRWIVKERT